MFNNYPDTRKSKFWIAGETDLDDVLYLINRTQALPEFSALAVFTHDWSPIAQAPARLIERLPPAARYSQPCRWQTIHDHNLQIREQLRCTPPDESPARAKKSADERSSMLEISQFWVISDIGGADIMILLKNVSILRQYQEIRMYPLAFFSHLGWQTFQPNDFEQQAAYERLGQDKNLSHWFLPGEHDELQRMLNCW